MTTFLQQILHISAFTDKFYLKIRSFNMKDNKTEVKHFFTMFDKYKNLLRELTRKNVKLKYRDSWLGIFWSFLQPLMTMIVLTVVFGNIFGANRKHIVCYPVSFHRQAFI